MKLIDLTTELAHHMPRFPSPYLPDVTLVSAASHARDGRSAHVLTMGTHVATHLDAPYHAVPYGKTVDQVPLEHLCGKAHVVRLEGHDRDHPITAADLQTHEVVLTAEKLILDTGWAERFWHQPSYFTEGPYLTTDAAEYLAGLGQLHLVGVDFANVDAPDDMIMGRPNPNHVTLLKHEIVIVENLLHLKEVETPCFFMALPPKLVGGDGCPCRAVAICGKDFSLGS